MDYISVGLLLISFQAALCQPVEIKNVPKNVTDVIYLNFYGDSVESPDRIKLEDGMTLPYLKYFKNSSKTVFYFPGWGEDPVFNKKSIETLAEAFLTRTDVNFVTIDYSKLVSSKYFFNYLGAVFNASTIGKVMGQYFRQYVAEIQPVEKLHLISHSLGCQILSRTAKEIAPLQFKWLTGLDPAGPLFNVPGVQHLSSADAEFVDIIHTDSYMFGDGRTVGTVDFFPNRGHRWQPSCDLSIQNRYCSHHMSWRLYALSVKNENLYPAVKCNRSFMCDKSFKSCKCDKNDIAYMGYDVSKNVQGTYYIETNGEPSFTAKHYDL